jgi:hypothetical protein
VNEPRKPIFGFLWPKPNPDAPVDGDYVQERLVRITRRGPIRLGAVIGGGIVLVGLLGTALLAGVQAGLSAPVFVVAAVCATALALVLRGSVVGTFVNDHQVTIETVLRRTEIPWSEVGMVTTDEVGTPFLGLPIPVPGSWTTLHLKDGTSVRTHVYSTSPDLWLRAEAFDIARLRLEHWRGA